MAKGKRATAAPKPAWPLADVAAPSGNETIDDLIRFLPQEYVARYPLADLEDFPGNPKEHDIALIDESIDANGWYGVIGAQRATRRIVYGHGRRETLLAKGQTHAPVMLIDCDDATARRIVLIDNRAPEKGGNDLARLADFLDTTQQMGELRGTGFSPDDVTKLVGVPDFRPSTVDDQGKLDELVPITCPNCGHKFPKP